MINLKDLDHGTILLLTINDTNIIECKIKEYGWSLHRHPLYAILEIIRSSNKNEWPIESEIYFPLETEENLEEMTFIHNAKCNFNSYIETTKKVKIHMEIKKEETVSPSLPEGVKNYMIDIDGTITEDVPNEQPERMSIVEPYEGSLEIINKWYDQGHIITFFTSRTDEHREITEEWLNRYGFKYHGILMNKPRFGKYVWIDNLDVTGIKFENTWDDLTRNNKLLN